VCGNATAAARRCACAAWKERCTYMRYVEEICQCRLMQQVIPALVEVIRISHINIIHYSKVGGTR
jgi:hypothetical protein